MNLKFKIQKNKEKEKKPYTYSCLGLKIEKKIC